MGIGSVARWLAVLLVPMAWAQAQSTTPKTNAENSSFWRSLQLAPSLQEHSRVEDHDMAAFLIADSIQASDDGHVILRGAAEVRRLDSVVKGEHIDYSQKTGQVNVQGDGMLMRAGSIVKSPSFQYNLDAETGQMEFPDFWLGQAGGAGKAEQAEIVSAKHLRLNKTTYQGCPCPDPAWYIQSPQVDLYFDDNEGVAKHGVLYFKGMPLLYSPWLSFPLTEERKSGFLVPAYAMSSKSGIDFSLPYYFNLAPNYDATLTPRYLSKRGLQLGAQFRYLQPQYHGVLEGTYLKRDRQRDIKRWLLHAEHAHNLGNGFGASVNINRVSDDDYFRDFSSFGLSESSTDFLASSAGVSWANSPYFSASLQAVKYQTLQDRTASVYRMPQYDKLPEFSFNAARYNWGGFDVVSKNTATRFSMPHFIYGTHPYPHAGELAPYQSYDGTRLSSYTSIAYPIVRAGWHFTPKVGLHASYYSTQWKGFGPPGIDWNSVVSPYNKGPKSQSRVLPIMSVDAGMTFERTTSLFGNEALQTLEPRLYYLRVPYRDQSALPIYDTALASFNMAQAFDENLFTGGWDRIADANQLTLGLTSRWLDADTGFERLSMWAAQRIYFDDQHVVLNPVEHNPRTKNKSDYLVGAQAALTDKFRVYFDAQFSPESRQRNSMSTGVRWDPKRLATVSLTYRYDRDQGALLYYRDPDADKTREQVSFMTQWPLHKQWYVMGRFDYSIKEKRSTQSILGLEYKGDCCWAARAVLQRYAVSRKDVNTAVFFQLELMGLGSLGTDAMGVLSDRIAGYRPVVEPLHRKTTFERYE